MATPTATEAKKGGCLCGAVRYRVAGPLRQLIACHCGQCRRTAGNFVVASAAYRADLSIAGEDALAWYASSPGIRRGFCRFCGSHLFWDREASPTVSILADSLDQPTGLRIVEYIFVDDKADFTVLRDDLPKRAQGGSTLALR